MSLASQYDIQDILRGAPFLKPISPEHTEIMVLNLLAELRARHLTADEWTRACELLGVINEHHAGNQMEVTGRALAVSRLILQSPDWGGRNFPETQRVMRGLVQSLFRRTLFDWFLCNAHEPILLPASDECTSERVVGIQDILERPELLPNQMDCNLTQEIVNKLGATVVADEQTSITIAMWKVATKLEEVVEDTLKFSAQLWLVADAMALREAVTLTSPHEGLRTLVRLGELTNALLADPELDPPVVSL